MMTDRDRRRARASNVVAKLFGAFDCATGDLKDVWDAIEQIEESG